MNVLTNEPEITSEKVVIRLNNMPFERLSSIIKYPSTIQYSVTVNIINSWFRSWNINLTSLGINQYMNNKFRYNNYCLDLKTIHISRTHNILTQADFDYKHMVILVKDGLESQIYVCTQDDQEFIKTPVELIDEYIERNDETDNEQK